MLQALQSLSLILTAGAVMTIAAMSLLLFPKSRPFAAGLSILAVAGTVIALAASAWIDDPPRWSRSAAMMALVSPTILLAVLRLRKAMRDRKSPGDRWRASASSHP